MVDRGCEDLQQLSTQKFGGIRFRNIDSTSILKNIIYENRQIKITPTYPLGQCVKYVSTTQPKFERRWTSCSYHTYNIWVLHKIWSERQYEICLTRTVIATHRSHKFHNSPLPYPMILHVHTSVKIWCIVEYRIGALWDVRYRYRPTICWRHSCHIVEQIIAYVRRIVQIMIQTTDLAQILYKGHPSRKKRGPRKISIWPPFSNMAATGYPEILFFCLKRTTDGWQRLWWWWILCFNHSKCSNNVINTVQMFRSFQCGCQYPRWPPSPIM